MNRPSVLDEAIVTVAVTGHRTWSGLSHDAVQARIEAILATVERRLVEALAGNSLDAARTPRFRFLSALAAGADQIAARAALARTACPGSPHLWDVQGLLPFDRAAYARTMEDQPGAREWLASVEALAVPTLELADWSWGRDGGDLDREWERRRFMTVGQMLVQQADLVIAVWQGNPGRGLGGTADVVAEAWRSGVPVVWLDPVSGAVFSLVPDASLRHVPALEIAGRLRMTADADGTEAEPELAAITHAIDVVLLGSDAARRALVSDHLADPGPITFALRERQADGSTGSIQRKGTSAFVYIAWLRMLLPKTLRPAPLRRGRAVAEPGRPLEGWFALCRRWPWVVPFETRWDEEVGRAARDDAIEPDRALQGEADRADLIANRAGNIYRSGYFLIFLFAAAAVCFALGFLLLGSLKPWLVPLEIAALALAFYVLRRHSAHGATLLGLRIRGRDYHNNFLEARMIAESLRSGRLQAWIGMAGRRGLEPHALEDPGDSHGGHAPQRPVWTPHFVNAVMAGVGLPAGRMTPARIAAIAGAASMLLSGQSRYHRANAARLEAFHHRLDALSIGFVATGFIAAVVYMALFGLKAALGWSEEHHDPGYTAYHLVAGLSAFLGGVLPALAAALTGIRYHGDFERFAKRSNDTVQQLGGVIVELDRLAGEVGAGSPPFERLAALLGQAQRVLEDDVADWRFAYAARPMPAP